MTAPTITFEIGKTQLAFDFPYGFRMFGWNFRWYGIIIAFGFLLAVLYALKRQRTLGINGDDLTDMLLCAVPCAILGARAYYVAFSDWKFTDWVDVFKIWNGGLAIYGGVMGAIIGLVLCWLWKRRNITNFRLQPYLDTAALGLLLGQTIGRWGNFANREAFGSETTLPWAMGLSYSDGRTIYVHPTFLYESLWNLIGFIVLHFYAKHRKYSGELFVYYIGWYGLGRVWIEHLRSDSLMLGGAIKISQLVAALCVVLSIVLSVRNLRKYKQSKIPPSVQVYAEDEELDEEFEKLLDEIQNS